MKLKTLYAVAAIALFSAFTNPAPPETDIIGKWKIDDASVNNATNRVLFKLKLANLGMAGKIEDQRNRIKEQIAAVRVTFSADHTTAIQSGDKTTAGTWNLSDNNHILSTTKNGVIRKDSILSLAATRIQLVGLAERDTVVYIRP
ncbi:DUF4923 family protein [Mucilaginibacter sp. ZT4R22]|uniref:DUF4923 family protein n=1 Tax=Mucilaginibacter pankratovii TaxID=2772110 RepID=A0ABR7WXS8_9SPHI|nr:DUF4923 family protein [Mucilaginibacter pankratovii]MBD1367095.1 DUF4923 family protein [Mucilaginibacter pankratovii]